MRCGFTYDLARVEANMRLVGRGCRSWGRIAALPAFPPWAPTASSARSQRTRSAALSDSSTVRALITLSHDSTR